MTAKAKEALFAHLGLNAVVVDGSTWYRQQFDVSGNWDSWIWDTVQGKEYDTRERHFAGFMVNSKRLGRASAGIVDLALRSGRAVLALTDEGQIETVLGVDLEDQENMVSGWTVRSAELKEVS